jgi:antitoxin MazE
MKVDVIRIGNSRGIRIPKPLIEQCGLGDTVDLRIERDHLVIAPHRQPREGWEKTFQMGHPETDELLLEPMGRNQFDRAEWEW